VVYSVATPTNEAYSLHMLYKEQEIVSDKYLFSTDSYGHHGGASVYINAGKLTCSTDTVVEAPKLSDGQALEFCTHNYYWNSYPLKVTACKV
jgi:hypothetical protein